MLQEFQILQVNGVAIETGPSSLVFWSRFGFPVFQE